MLFSVIREKKRQKVFLKEKDFSRRGLQKHAEPFFCSLQLPVWVVPNNQSVAVKLLDQVLIRMIQFEKNIRLQPKIIKCDPRAPNHRNKGESFETFCENQDCFPASSFFLFHDIKSSCLQESDPEQTEEETESIAFTDSYDRAGEHSKSMVDEHVSNLTITHKEVQETERQTPGQKKNNLWYEKRNLTASNFGKWAKTKVEPSNRVKSILHPNYRTDDLQYGIKSEQKQRTYIIYRFRPA